MNSTPITSNDHAKPPNLRALADRSALKLTWQQIIAAEPQLADLAYAIAVSAVPTREPQYGRAWLAILDALERLAKRLGDAAFAVARDRLHRIFTDGALREVLFETATESSMEVL